MSTFRHLLISLALAVGGVVLLVLSGMTDLDWLRILGLNCLLLGPVWAMVAIGRALFRRFLWRVGRRLLLSYLLIGIVPIPFILGLAFVLVYAVSGQLAARRVETQLELARADLRAVVHTLEHDLDPGLDADAIDARLRSAHPFLGGDDIGWALQRRGEPAIGRGPLAPELLLRPDRIHSGLEAIGKIEPALEGAERSFLVVVEPGESGAVALAYWCLEPGLRRQLERATDIAINFRSDRPLGRQENSEEEAGEQETPPGVDVRIGDDEPGAYGPPGVRIGANGDRNVRFEAFERAPAPVAQGGIFGRPFVYWTRMFELPQVDWGADDWHAAIEGDEERQVPFLVWTSIAREYQALFNSQGADQMNVALGEVTVQVMTFLAAAIAVSYLLAFLLTGILVYRIAKATGRLHRGFAHIERGDFRHRVQLRGRDQLSELVQGFNRMAEHLGESVEQRAEKEALERELQIARDLQRSLLPPADFRTEGFSLAVDFQPAAAIGGDFYHLARWPDGRLIVAIADVSGHGLSTGIVMAAAKALLSALSGDLCPCAELFERLDRELRALTGRRTFVTMGLCAFDWHAMRVEYTNAGQLYPYRVQANGELSQLVNPSRPLGVALPQNFRTIAGELAAGDLFFLLSDGFIEAVDPNGEVFGFDRFEMVARSCAGQSAEAARDTLLRAWREFTRAHCPEDDRTLLVLRVSEPGLVRAGDHSVQSEAHVG